MNTTVLVNGCVRELSSKTTLRELLEVEGISTDDCKGCAVAVNQHIIPAVEWKWTEVFAGDCVEIVHAVYGG